MHVPKKADKAMLIILAGQNMGRGGFGEGFRLDRAACFINGLKITPVQRDVGGVFVVQNHIGLGARRHQNGAGLQGVRAAIAMLNG